MDAAFQTFCEQQAYPALLSGEAVTLLLFPEAVLGDSFTGAPELSPREQDRARRFKNVADARAFVCGRVFTRRFLQGLFPGREIELTLSPQGKPLAVLSGAPHFSISHGGDACVLSFCQTVPVGVDIENPSRRASFERIARRYFSPAEQRYLEEQGSAERFYRIWTRKEARLKASGDGFTVQASEICTLTEPGWHYQELVQEDSRLAVAATPRDIPHRLLYPFR